MNLYHVVNQDKVVKSGSMDTDVNDLDRDAFFEFNTVPAVFTADLGANAESLSHIYVECLNVDDLSVTLDTHTLLSDVSPTKTFTDGLVTRQALLMPVETSGALPKGQTLTLTISTEQNANVPTRLYRFFALRQRFHLPVNRTFRTIDWTHEERGAVQYESLYDEIDKVPGEHREKTRARFQAQRLSSSQMRNLRNFRRRFATFLYEYDFESEPEEVFPAVFEGTQTRRSFTTQYTPNGYTLGFSILER